MEFLARVNPKYFAAINLFAAAKDIRYYLNGVFIEPHPEKGVIIVATNGHTLGLIHDPDGWVAKPIIVGSLSKALISACTKKGTIRGLNTPTALYISERGAVVHAGEEMDRTVDPFSEFTTHLSKIEIIDAKFPDYRKVLPTKRQRGEIFPCINAQYLALLHQVAGILALDKWGVGVELEQRDRALSVVARINAHEIIDRFVALIMPMHHDAPKDILPDWLMPKEEPTPITC